MYTCIFRQLQARGILCLFGLRSDLHIFIFYIKCKLTVINLSLVFFLIFPHFVCSLEEFMLNSEFRKRRRRTQEKKHRKENASSNRFPYPRQIWISKFNLCGTWRRELSSFSGAWLSLPFKSYFTIRFKLERKFQT